MDESDKIKADLIAYLIILVSLSCWMGFIFVTEKIFNSFGIK